MGLAKRITDDAGWAVLRMVASLVRVRGPGYAVVLGRALGRLAWSIPGGRRRLSLENAAVALPHLSPRERRRVVREAIMNSFAYWPEPVTYAYRGPRNVLRTVSVEGREHLDAALAKGNGVIAPGIHLGIFPLMAIWMTQAGYDFQFLSRFPHNDRAVELMTHMRALTGIKVIRDLPRRQCLIDCRGVLNRGGIICLQLDQRAMSGLPGVDVPFCGRTFHAFGGMVSLALKSGAPLVPMYVYRERGIRHRFVIEPEVRPNPDIPRKQAVIDVIEKLMRRFEVWVREHPEQWWWPRRIWKDD